MRQRAEAEEQKKKKAEAEGEEAEERLANSPSIQPKAKALLYGVEVNVVNFARQIR